MRKLETYINEKLRVTKSLLTSDLSAIVESKTKQEFDSKCEQLIEYLKNDSNLPIAELQVSRGGFKQLLREYENSHDTFLWVTEDVIYFGEWGNVDYINWNDGKGCIKIIKLSYGFSSFTTTDAEISKYGGVYIITENSELMKQIDYLMQKAEPYV